MATNIHGIECPHCNYFHCDSDYMAYGSYEGVTTCEACEKLFKYRLQVTTTWVTEKEGFTIVA